jgi:site-specific DNA-methyltransferase (adenine-specific)/modification methylase
MSKPWRRREVIGEAVLYLGDCLEVLPTLRRFDLCLVDPPYGIGEAAGRNKSRAKLAIAQDYGNEDWDNAPLNAVTMMMVLASAKRMIVWGGNYYPLPPASQWLVWDKENGDNDFADCELAWTNLGGAVRRFRHQWHGMLRASEKGPRLHPTQKPVALMRWCLNLCGDISSVIDPCMGSAPVGIACVERGIPYTGIDSSERHYQIACERIENAYRQQSLFPRKEARKPEQESLL